MIGEWTALPVGIIIATLANMVGLAGGILWMPYLLFVAGLAPGEAVMTSLMIQIVGMGSGAVTVLFQGKVNPKLALMLSAAALPGVAVGFALKGFLEPRVIVFLVGVAAMAAALLFVIMREDYEFLPVRDVPARAVLPYLWMAPVLSIQTGLLSTGVGDLLVPTLRKKLGMKMDTAIGTCLVVMAINAAFASALYGVTGGSFAPPILFWGAIGVLIGGQIGPRLADKIPDQTLKEVFIYGLSLVGIHVLFNA